MTKARKDQVSLDVTSTYHCVTRCVRRAFLCGYDKYSKTSYEHRRKWVEDRLFELSDIFAIDIYAYSVMSNHVHTVLNINAAKAHSWTDFEVCERWHRLYKGTLLTQKFERNEPLSKVEWLAVKERLDQWRLRLFDISDFMRALNEPIARKANAEDRCTGRFWEGRFKSQALCDDAAVVACMAYVDLNPVRAKVAETPETSEFTSIKSRIDSVRQQTPESEVEKIVESGGTGELQPKSLAPFVGNPREPMPRGIPFELRDYIELVDWTGRVIRSDKRGAIAAALPAILDRLDIEYDSWLQLTTMFEQRLKTFVGSSEHIDTASMKLGYRRTPNRASCKKLFG